MTFTKVAALFDIHYPYNINLNPVFNFLYDFKPDRIIFGGDCLDLAYLSHWNEMSPGKWQGHNLQRDFTAMGNMIDDLQSKIKPKNIDYIIGNHCEWLSQFADKFPYLKEKLDISEGLKAKERGINIVGYNKVLKVGKLNYMHGVYVNDTHAKKTIMTYQRCIRYGHTHDYQVHPLISPIDSNDVRNAMSCGCLCNRKPEYMHGKPNRWVHGFQYAYMWPNGSFTDQFVTIIKNKFIVNGKEYK
jgi:predicted phosphodiesterase